MRSRVHSWLTYAMLCAFGGCTEIGPIAERDSGTDAEAQRRSEPDASLLCEIQIGQSTSSDVERILGGTDRRETAESTTLLYQYATGLTLSLLFRADVFVGGTVYNGTYPACWAEAERSARELAGQDGGIRD